MSQDAAAIASRLAEVRRRVADAERAAGRAPGTVRVLLATKTQSVETVRRAVEADARACATTGDAPVLLGESRVQDLAVKAAELGVVGTLGTPNASTGTADHAIHFVGALQSNKVNQALRWTTCVQTLATVELARRLSARCAAVGRVLDVMVQVNVSGERTKSGVVPAEAAALASRVAELPGLRLTGFMTIGANSPDTQLVRSGYALLRQVRDDVRGSGLPGTGGADGLSMGMSRDLELAIAEGATIVRVGSAVFGARLPT